MEKEYESIWFYDSTSLNDYTFSLLEPCTGYDLQMQKVCIGGGSEWIDLGTVISTGCPVSCADYPITGITVSSITKILHLLIGIMQVIFIPTKYRFAKPEKWIGVFLMFL